MESVITTVVPVFALIVLGFGAGRFGFFVEGAARGLSTFVFTFAIPAMLFKAMVTLGIPASPPWGLWGAFFAAVAVVWILAIAASRFVTGLEGAGGASAALGAGFGNTVMLGLPLGVAYFGTDALLPMALIISIHLPVQWFAATLLAQWGSQTEKQGFSVLLRTLAKDLLTNPIVLALLAGSLWNLAGFGLNTDGRKNCVDAGPGCCSSGAVCTRIVAGAFRADGQRACGRGAHGAQAGRHAGGCRRTGVRCF